MKAYYAIVHIEVPISVAVDDDVEEERVCQIIREEIEEMVGCDGDDEDFDLWKIELMDVIKPENDPEFEQHMLYLYNMGKKR